MGAISEVEWEPCLLDRSPDPELERRFERETGRPGEMMQYLHDCPWLGDAVVRLSVQHKTLRYLDHELADLVGLIISQDNSCRFCFGLQRAYLRVIGISEARIERMKQDQLSAEFSRRERAVLEFAKRVSRSRPLVHKHDVEALREAGLRREEIAELGGLAVSHLFFNRLATLAAFPPLGVESFPDRTWVRLLRPLLAIRFRRMRRRAPEVRLSEAEKSGNGAAIINALDGLPNARDLRIVMDGMWRAGPLSTRTLGLLFAVVARALDCAHCENEARAVLEADGLAASDIDHILAHLSSPLLTREEALLIPLARETVWYQPALLQRRCAQVREQIERDEFMHFIGAAAFINALCRVAFLAELD